MSAIVRLNMESTEHTGNLTIPYDKNRGYFMIKMTSGTGTVELGVGGGKLPLTSHAFYEPLVCPTSEITVETTGTFIIIMG